MQCSLYGKLPSKRDFIAIGAPRGFLDTWEPWLQGSVSASRVALGEKWQAAFLTAPVWRFWLGADVCGKSVIGAFMPSSDGIGRYFPLTLFVCADDDAAIPPPEFGAQEDWFKSAEDFLISTLDEDRTFEAIAEDLKSLALPQQEGPKAAADEEAPNGEPAAFIVGEKAFSDIFETMRRLDYDKIYASASYWWTIGGEGFPPIALCEKRMPNPHLFSAMLTGKFPSERS